jgi:hypothetical protein
VQAHFLVEFAAAFGQCAQRVARRIEGARHAGVAEFPAVLDELPVGEFLQFFA